MSNGYKEYVSSDYVVQHTPMIQDDTFTKIIKALPNTDYTIKQVIITSTYCIIVPLVYHPKVRCNCHNLKEK